MTTLKSPVVIVGGGITGLTLADRLATRGVDCVLIEREPRLGGLARSIELDGQAYDLGPHRFFTQDQDVMSYINAVAGDNLDSIERKTSFHLFNRYFSWPINRQVIMSLPWKESARIGLDLLLRSNRSVNNFEDFIINRYGPTLYRIFFKPVTDKFFRMPSRLVHPEWATLSVDRSIIDRYHRIDSIGYLLWRLFTRQPPFHFLYPRRGGMQSFIDSQERRVRKAGVEIRVGVSVNGVKTEGGQITRLELSDGAEITPGTVVWTGAVNRLHELVTGEKSPLAFLSTILVYIVLKKAIGREEQWIYFPEEIYRLLRLACQSNFYRQDRDSFRAICLEVTASENERILEEPDKIYPWVVRDLANIGLIGGPDDIVDHKVMLVPESYPVYDIEYHDRLLECLNRLLTIPNLYLAGRSGMFWYNNMDNCIKSAIEFDRWTAQGHPPNAEEKARWVMQGRDKY